MQTIYPCIVSFYYPIKKGVMKVDKGLLIGHYKSLLLDDCVRHSLPHSIAGGDMWPTLKLCSFIGTII